MIIVRIFFAILIALFLTSCSLIELKEDIDKQKNLSQLFVNVYGSTKQNGKIVVLVIDTKRKMVLKNYRILRGNGKVDFLLLPSKYTIYLYDQNNHILSYDVDLSKQKEYNLYVDINDTVHKRGNDALKILEQKVSLGLHNGMLYNGEVVPLNSNIFDQKNIKKGLWRSYAFIEDVPFGIFLQKPYDPNKKVVLFVHGISGSPRNFAYLIKNLDHSKYQPFYAYYPTGVDLDTAANYLAMVVSELQIRYGFTSMAVVAHSMGGLVSRKMLTKLKKKYKMTNIIDTFVTISSPLDGDKRADYGVHYAPVIMPSIEDIAHSSLFVKHLYDEPLEEGINYYLIFGYKENSADDGVVSIASQLRLQAQEEAKIVRGYNKTHMSILDSKKVSDLLNSVLDTF